MMGAGMCRKAYAALVAAAMVVQAPVAWAQLADIDPALHAAVEALVTSDPEVAGDPELADLCRTIAEATVTDPRERAAVTGEVVEMAREGIDINTVIPSEVREAAREQFAKYQGEMQEKLETLRASDPEMAREMELMMREGERQMVAFETGERYTPSREMVAHAETMMKEWETDMAAHGAPPEYIERARGEFAAWSSGEMNPAEMMAAMGPGHEMMAAGGTHGEMPSPEEMEAMVAIGQMTPDQLEMAKEFMQAGQTMEQQYMEQQYHDYVPMDNQVYDNTQSQLFQERTEFVNHVGHPVDHDNNPGTPDQVHVHEIHIHSDGTRDDHTTPNSGL